MIRPDVVDPVPFMHALDARIDDLQPAIRDVDGLDARLAAAGDRHGKSQWQEIEPGYAYGYGRKNPAQQFYQRAMTFGIAESHGAIAGMSKTAKPSRGQLYLSLNRHFRKYRPSNGQDYDRFGQI
jgi:hypothetical protein